MKTIRFAFAILVAAAVLLSSRCATGQTFNDSLTDGYSATNWVLRTNSSFFTVATNVGYVSFSKTAGTVSGFAYAGLASLLAAEGDFTVQVEFTNANIGENDSAGNQIQLNTRFGGQNYLTVRSCESEGGGQQAHIWVSPPSQVEGLIGFTNSSGTLRVSRVGTLVSGYIDSTLLYSGTFNTNVATFSFVLQFYGTTGAASAGFLNFQLTADNIVPLPRQLSAEYAPPGQVVVSWPDASWPDLLAGYTLLASTNLTKPSPWQVVVSNPVPVNNMFFVTNAVSTPSTFYIFQQGP
jgi:hypothetical protein